MRDRRARFVMISLILAFPLLAVLASPRPAEARSTALTVAGLEIVLAGGLMTALRERRRLLQASAARRTPSPAPVGVGPHVARSRPTAVRVRPSAR